MSRAKSIKKVMAYFYVPLLFCVIGYGILYVTLSPILSPVLSSLSLIISESKPDNSSKIQSIFNSQVLENTKDTVDEKNVEMPTYGTHYAELKVKSASIKADLYFGDSTDILKKGVGQYFGSSIPGYGKPLLICGHNNKEFNRLQYVGVGDTITITTNYGLYTYKITETRVTNAHDKNAFNLNQQKEQLILYTCYPFNTLGLTSKRFFVYADKISGPIIVSGSQG